VASRSTSSRCGDGSDRPIGQKPSPRTLSSAGDSMNEKLVGAALDFFCDLVRFSEPYEAPSVAPPRKLVAADWDDNTFAECSPSTGRLRTRRP
jgi:hypothetical protein